MGFLPSSNGFGFDNSWPDQPSWELPTPLGPLGVGNDSGGLCGGMVFGAMDHFLAGRPTPAARPQAGTALHAFVVRRLVDSWHLPSGVARYYRWMNLSDADTDVESRGVHLTTRRGLAWRTIDGQWPRVRSALDAGSPVALAVVTVASSRVRDLARNHQVLAYRYQARRERVRLWVYDPNRAGDDDVTISFDTCAPARATDFHHTLGIDHRVRGFFVSHYSPVPPPPTPS